MAFSLLEGTSSFERSEFMVKIGDKIRIIRMLGEKNYSGKTGIVLFIDCASQIHGTWGSCAIIPGVDLFEVVKD